MYKRQEASKTGPATNILQGFSLGLKSTAIVILLLAASIIGSFMLGGAFGVALAAVGMLSTVALTISVDTYGPIADNAGGIAEMSGQPESIREITDTLDSAGNTTAAIGKGFSICSAALTALLSLIHICTREPPARGEVDFLRADRPVELLLLLCAAGIHPGDAVSYTHLDVYKRQAL